MILTAVHLPVPIPSLSLTRSPSITTSIRTQFLHSTSINICTDSSFKLCCLNNRKSSQDFSILKTDLQCDSGSTWSTMAFYIFSLHIPLSFGGLSVVAQLLHQTDIDPNTQAFSLLLIQTLELVSFLSLLKLSNTRFNIVSLFETRDLPKERNWLLASVVGVGFLLALVFFTSLIADKLVGPKDVNNPILKEILSDGPLSVTGSTLVYCLVAPFLEETVYRGFLLTSLASTMKWEKAVVEVRKLLEKSELDKYLVEDREPMDTQFDILQWWKIQQCQYPVLAKMARDILAIQFQPLPSSRLLTL